MDETFSLIIRGCQLARDLESNLLNFANQPNILSKSCDEIIKIFINAQERLISAQYLTSYPHIFFPAEPHQSQPSSQIHTGVQDHQTSYPHMFFPEPHQSQPSQIDTGLQEWPMSNYTQVMTTGLQTRVLTGKGAFNVPGLPESKPGLGLEVPVTELGGRDMEGSARLRGSTGGEFQAVGASDSGRSSSSQRSRRRTETPPEDGFAWRRYDMKEIRGFRFPRGYFRCNQCPAKKQVQQLDDDPSTFDVTYQGSHTCHMSSPAPSVAPQEMNQTTTSAPLDKQLSMEIWPTGEGINTFMDSHAQMYMNFGLSGAGGSSSSIDDSDGAGPSTVRGREAADYHFPKWKM